MMTLEKFEDATEVVKRVTSSTKLVYSDYLSEQTGGRVYLKPENMQHTGPTNCGGPTTRSAPFPRRNGAGG